MAAFRMQRTRQLEQRLLAGDQWQDWGLVFSSSKGTPLDGPNVNKRLQKLLEQAGLPRQRFHDLRHGCASLLLAAGVPPRTIMGVLGHSQISLTLNTYSHLSPALERDMRQMRWTGCWLAESVLQNRLQPWALPSLIGDDPVRGHRA
jgi:integrase